MSTSDANKYSIVLRFTGGNSERLFLNERLNNLKETEALVYPAPIKEERNRYYTAYSLDYVVSSIVMIIAAAGSLAAIAQLIYEFRKNRSRNEKIASSSRANNVYIKKNSTEIEITGDFSIDDVLEIIQKSKREGSSEEAAAWLRQEKDKLRIKEIESELKSIEYAIPKYARLIELFEEDLEKLKPWQIKRYEESKSKMKELEEEARCLRKELGHLHKEIDNLREILKEK